MTLGEKIRKYRTLHKKSQRRLGEDLGFKESTADVRTNQYENNKIIPKADIRFSIAKALDIDIEAISDIDIQSFEDVMYILFEFEEKLGLEVEKKDNKTYLVLDDSNNDISTLITYINLWNNQKKLLLTNSDSPSEEQIRNYELWKSRFVSNIRDSFTQKNHEIEACYQPLIIKAKPTYQYSITTSDFVLLLRQIIEAGVHISTTYHYDNGCNDIYTPGFTFIVNELLNMPSDLAKELFTKFLMEFDHFKELGAEVTTEMQMPEQVLTITYYVKIPTFNVIASFVDDFMNFQQSEQTKFSKDNFEAKFKSDLKTYYNIIADEINFYNRKMKTKKK
jgi:transcriptional regulator with XRE-family HTH domain